jgi:Sulfotransferase family
MSPLLSLIKEHVVHPGQLIPNIMLRLRHAESQRKHVFIVGPPRCGTTLIKSLICAHPGFCGLKYETTGLLGYRNIFSLELDELAPSRWEAIKSNAKTIANLYDAVCDEIQHSETDILPKNSENRFVDKIISTDHITISWVKRSFPNAQYVGILRDPRDAYLSASKIDGFAYTETPLRFSKHWRRKVRQMANIENLNLVRYEDLVCSTDETLRKVMLSLDASYNKEALSNFSRTTNLHLYDAKHRNLGKEIFRDSVGIWKKELNTQYAKTIKDACSPLMRQYGYINNLKCNQQNLPQDN